MKENIRVPVVMASMILLAIPGVLYGQFGDDDDSGSGPYRAWNRDTTENNLFMPEGLDPKLALIYTSVKGPKGDGAPILLAVAARKEGKNRFSVWVNKIDHNTGNIDTAWSGNGENGIGASSSFYMKGPAKFSVVVSESGLEMYIISAVFGETGGPGGTDERSYILMVGIDSEGIVGDTSSITFPDDTINHSDRFDVLFKGGWIHAVYTGKDTTGSKDAIKVVSYDPAFGGRATAIVDELSDNPVGAPQITENGSAFVIIHNEVNVDKKSVKLISRTGKFSPSDKTWTFDSRATIASRVVPPIKYNTTSLVGGINAGYIVFTYEEFDANFNNKDIYLTVRQGTFFTELGHRIKLDSSVGDKTNPVVLPVENRQTSFDVAAVYLAGGDVYSVGVQASIPDNKVFIEWGPVPISGNPTGVASFPLFRRTANPEQPKDVRYITTWRERYDGSDTRIMAQSIDPDTGRPLWDEDIIMTDSPGNKVNYDMSSVWHLTGPNKGEVEELQYIFIWENALGNDKGAFGSYVNDSGQHSGDFPSSNLIDLPLEEKVHENPLMAAVLLRWTENQIAKQYPDISSYKVLRAPQGTSDYEAVVTVPVGFREFFHEVDRPGVEIPESRGYTYHIETKIGQTIHTFDQADGAPFISSNIHPPLIIGVEPAQQHVIIRLKHYFPTSAVATLVSIFDLAGDLITADVFPVDREEVLLTSLEPAKVYTAIAVNIDSEFIPSASSNETLFITLQSDPPFAPKGSLDISGGSGSRKSRGSPCFTSTASYMSKGECVASFVSFRSGQLVRNIPGYSASGVYTSVAQVTAIKITEEDAITYTASVFLPAISLIVSSRNFTVILIVMLAYIGFRRYRIL